nr:MAG TPA_asm: hypothetical protein [Caudoviricetes sp.]
MITPSPTKTSAIKQRSGRKPPRPLAIASSLQ